MMMNGFFVMDEELRKKQSENDNDRSGSTAITAFVTPTHIIVGNLGILVFTQAVLFVGDSRCLLARGDEAIPLSFDHKPKNVHTQFSLISLISLNSLI